jgi:nitrite reductase (NADH) large subunit
LKKSFPEGKAIKKYLIIGNGVAGTTAAEYLRKQDDKGDITIITDEDLPFYYRIRLNDYICGDIGEQDLVAKPPAWYAEKRIRLRTGTKITAALPRGKAVVTETGDKLYYDYLLLATGSHSFAPPIAGIGKKGVFTLRTIADARRIRAFSDSVDTAVLIGGGLLGLETGKALRKKGKRVTVVEFLPRLLPRQLDGRGADRLKHLLEDMGFTFHIGATTQEIIGTDGVEGVVLKDGPTIPARMVIVSAGVRPNLDLARLLDLECDKGILVDAALRTSRPEIFAAGDVAQFQGMLYGIWPAAMEQGRAAGINMAGGRMEYPGSTMMTKLKVVGIDLASAGEIDPDNKYESRVHETAKVYKKFVIDANRLIGCIMLGDTKGFTAMTRAIAEKTDLAEVGISGGDGDK